MAKILPGPAISAASGSVGNLVFTRSAFGAGIRVAAVPTQPNTPAQQTAKASAVAAAKAWGQILTPGQRADWQGLSLAHPRTDVFSQTVYLTGMQLYLSANAALKKIGVARIDDIPAYYSCTAVSTVTLTWNDALATLTVAVTPPPAGTEVPVIWASKMFGMGRKASKTGLTVIDYQAAGDAGPWDISADYQAKKGVFVKLRSITVKVQFTDNTNGCQGVAVLNQVLLLP